MKIHSAYYLLLAGIFLSCHSTYELNVDKTTHYDPGTTGMAASDSAMMAVINPYQQELNKIMDEVLVRSEVAIEKGKPESKLGNLVADMCYEIATKEYKKSKTGTIDFCLLNNGGLRSSLPAGNVTRKNVYELMPFENELVVLTVSGATTKKILKYISAAGGVPVSHLQMQISDSTFHAALISGMPFDSTRLYTVVTSDYLADGGDNMNMLKETISKESLNIKVRDAIINNMIEANKRNEKLNPELDGRIQP